MGESQTTSSRRSSEDRASPQFSLSYTAGLALQTAHMLQRRPNPMRRSAHERRSIGGRRRARVQRYRKYIAEGRQTAEGLSNQPYSTRAPNDNLQVLVERMLRFQAEMLPLWIETLATLVKVDPAQNGYAPSSDAWRRSNGARRLRRWQ